MPATIDPLHRARSMALDGTMRQIVRVTAGAWINDTFDLNRLEHASCAVASGPDAAMLENLEGALACKACGYRADSPLSGYLADCFDLRHLQWGLRGDPHVWRMLRDGLWEVATPRDVPAALDEAFEAATGVDLRADESEQIYREEFDHGGMSGGVISLDWWRDKAIPLMTQRATQR